MATICVNGVYHRSEDFMKANKARIAKMRKARKRIDREAAKRSRYEPPRVDDGADDDDGDPETETDPGPGPGFNL